MKTRKFLQYIPLLFAFLFFSGDLWGQCVVLQRADDNTHRNDYLITTGDERVCANTLYMLFHKAGASKDVTWDWSASDVNVIAASYTGGAAAAIPKYSTKLSTEKKVKIAYFKDCLSHPSS